MSNPIIVNFTAHNKRGSGGYQETFSVETAKELADAVNEFDKNCPFTKYEMETYAEHANGDPLTEEERAMFEEEDDKNDIGF